MSDDNIEAKALSLLNEVLTKKGFGDDCRYAFIQPENDAHQALCRAVEQHEAYKQKVSDVMTYIKELYPTLPRNFNRFIIPKPKPDPLVEAWIEATGNTVGMGPLNAALEARGLEIREKGQ
jgi:hypothetical protein